MARTVSVSGFQRMMDEERAANEPVEPKPEDRPDAGGPRVADVNPDGTVRDWRRPDATPDRGPDVGTTHHVLSDSRRITDDEPRFSGAGTSWTSTNDDDELPRTAPWMVLRVPTEAEFGDDEFIASTALPHRAEILADRHPDQFGHLADLKVVYLWKKTGGKAKGKGVYGKTAKASGLVKHFSEKAAFVIWLAADHCRGASYSERQLEALLFHEMCHTSVAEADPETGRGGGPSLVPHDVEMFRAEVEVYGLWDADLRDVAPAFRQGQLFDAPIQRSGSAVANDGAGTLIHADGSLLTDDEIEAMERHERNDDPSEDASGLDCRECGGALDLERPSSGGLCRPCREAEEAERNPYEEPDTPDELPSGEEIDAARAASGFAASNEDQEEDILLDDPV